MGEAAEGLGIHRRARSALPRSPERRTSTLDRAAVRFESIHRSDFPACRRCTDVTLDVAAGSCHALCGENGAGKSTLGKILAGHSRARRRTAADPRPARSASRARATRSSPASAWCTRSSRSATTSRWPRTSASARSRRAEGSSSATPCGTARASMLAEIGARPRSRRARWARSAIAQQQLVQIAAAVGGGARIIVFDEPTSSLSQAEADRLYELIDATEGARRDVHLRLASACRRSTACATR